MNGRCQEPLKRKEADLEDKSCLCNVSRGRHGTGTVSRISFAPGQSQIVEFWNSASHKSGSRIPDVIISRPGPGHGSWILRFQSRSRIAQILNLSVSPRFYFESLSESLSQISRTARSRGPCPEC